MMCYVPVMRCFVTSLMQYHIHVVSWPLTSATDYYGTYIVFDHLSESNKGLLKDAIVKC